MNMLSINGLGKILRCAFLIMLVSNTAILAQQAQVEQSQRFRTEALPRLDPTDSDDEESAFSDSPDTPGDSDLGDQLLLFEEPPYNPFLVGASFTVSALTSQKL